ncbi:MAG: sigma-70 family RNA polymerase sigma factor [Limisphaerales bacterium]
MPVAVNNDAELVHGTLAGNRDAFSQIVSRYQSLICSLAYSATGSLGQSEDLAQETFITAWKHLGHLRERDKLRAWLCGIARNRINNFLRREGREPIREAEPLENISESQSSEPLPTEQTITNEEQAILWRSLERIPEIYREPLVLFYREHQSIEAVAQSLDLTEDNVKQRLSRGRKLLHEQVLVFVEGALERTNPGKVFTVGVLAALPAVATSAKAATLGAAAAKGATAKSATAGLLGIILSPLLIVFGNYVAYRMNLAEAHTEEQRADIKSMYRKICLIVAGFFAVLAGPTCWFFWNQKLMFSLLFVELVVIYVLTTLICIIHKILSRRKHFAGQVANDFPQPAYEYRSRLDLFGLPFIHIRIGDRYAVLRKPVKAWIAVGDCAFGGLFAFGGIAIAPVSIGGCAFGLAPLGGITMGLFAMGAITLGVGAFGGLALGFWSFGGCAIAWKAAMGGVAIAHDFAVGGVAHALQANNELATQFFHSNMFFRCTQFAGNHSILFNLIWVIPMIVQWWIIAKKSRERKLTNS